MLFLHLSHRQGYDTLLNLEFVHQVSWGWNEENRAKAQVTIGLAGDPSGYMILFTGDSTPAWKLYSAITYALAQPQGGRQVIHSAEELQGAKDETAPHRATRGPVDWDDIERSLWEGEEE